MKKCLIIDGQILQTGAWYRGMGKYMLQVLQELNDNPPADTEISLLFNTALGRDELRLETVKYMYPSIKHVYCNLPLAEGGFTKLKIKAYKSQLTNFIGSEFPDTENFYLLTSLFLFDFFAEFPAGCHPLVMFYDLTPLLFWRDLGGYFPPDLYMPRFQRLLEAEHIFAISETTRRDLLLIFGLDPATVTNINGGFTKIADKTSKPSAFKVPKNYILLPTGDLPHKNNDVAVRGFENYRKSSGSETPLLITSRFSDASKERLLAISSHVMFTGNVSDEELEWLYQNAGAVLFASKYEGLGMPVLDAVASNKPIIASRIPVFEEMSKQAFYYFDPNDAASLSEALESALNGRDFKQKLTHYPAVMSKYTWTNTVNGIRDYLGNFKREVAVGQNRPRPRIAVASLNPGLENQIGRLSEPLHYSLTRHFEVDYYFDGNGTHFREMERPTFLDYMDAKIFDITKLDIHRYKKYETVVFLLDATTIPSRLAQRACVLPGIALTNGFDGLDDQGLMLKRIALDNQVATHPINGSSYEDCQALVTTIMTDIGRKSAAPSPAENILRHPGTNSGIIKKLKALTVL